MARPTTYTEEIGSEICRRIADGATLIEVCNDHGILTDTVMGWLEQQSRFAQDYARARVRQIDHFADDILMIAKTEKDPNRAKLMVDTRKWLMARLNAKKYGDKLQHTGADGDGPVVIRVQDEWARPVIDGGRVALEDASSATDSAQLIDDQTKESK